MRNALSPRFDTLEERKLLTSAHAETQHLLKPLSALVLSGTLAVNAKKMVQIQNVDSSNTITLPVSGTLATLGKVHGEWNETSDAYGGYQGPDTIQLTSAKGSVVIAFNNATPGKAYPSGPKTFYYQHPQHLLDATGAYRHTTESGIIQINTNATKSSILSVTITSPQ